MRRRIGFDSVSRLAAGLAVAQLACVAAAGAQSLVRPAPWSPLATDGSVVYAVASDGETILTRRIRDEAGAWRRLSFEWPRPTSATGDRGLPPSRPSLLRASRQAPASGAASRRRIGGLAWANGVLFFTDPGSASVYLLSTIKREPTAERIAQGSPLQQPTEITVHRGLIIADPGAGALFRLAAFGGGPPTPLPVRGLNVHAGVHLAGSLTELIVSDDRTGLIAQVKGVGFTRTPAVWELQQRAEPDKSPVQRYEKTSRSVRRPDYAGVEKPGAVAVKNGIVYVIDEAAGQVFAAAIHDARAVRLGVVAPGSIQPARVLATEQDLLLLDARTGHVVRRPRPVPAEMRVTAGATEALADVYQFLHRRGQLATRRLTVQGPLGESLRAARVAPVLPVTPIVPLLCDLNPGLCRGGPPPDMVEVPTPIVIPDFYSERYVDVDRITLNGSMTLGQKVDHDVMSDEFASYRDEAYLRQINGLPREGAALREAREGTYRSPREQIRYVTAFDSLDLSGKDSELWQIVRRHATLRLVPLERVLSTIAAAPAQAHPDDPGCLEARKAFEAMLGAIRYVQPQMSQRPVHIGVAEKAGTFNRTHPDFEDQGGAPVFIQLDADDPPADGGAASTNGSSGAGGERVTYRPFEARDHATAVASLLAARSRPFGPALIPNIFIVPLHDEDPGLSQDVQRGVIDTGTTVFNLSLKLLSESAALRDEIYERADLALFVVAAGNDGKEVCKAGHFVYPACWGRQKNVLVVGGTDLNGRVIQPLSNKGGAVHLVAPGEGYFAAGHERGYVKVEGTSFATALVSLTAAIFVSLGFDEPALIKQRLIATADVDPNLPAWARRLNVKRALSNVEFGVLTTLNGVEEVVHIAKDSNVEFLVAGGGPLTVRLSNIRRLTRDPSTPSNYQLVYADPIELPPPDDKRDALRIVRVRAPQGNAQWKFTFQTLGSARQPVGAFQTGDLAEYLDYVGKLK